MWPPLPEMVRVTHVERFDDVYHAGVSNELVTIPQYGTLRASWSGYSLERVGTVTPLVIAGLGESGQAQVATGQGAVRFWFSPYWSSSEGPGAVVPLAQLFAVAKSQAAGLWSLQVNADGSTLSLMGPEGRELLLAAKIEWAARSWHQVVLNYGTNGTELVLDGEVVTQGGATLSVPASVARLIVGSTLAGDLSAGGEFEEVYCFARPLKVAFHYLPFAGIAELGPMSEAELTYRQELLAKWVATKAQKAREAEESGGGGVQMRLSGPSADCITNGPVYLTNVVANFTTNEGWTVYFDIAGGTNEVVYDIFSTTEFLGNDITNSTWTWLETGQTCETHWFTNQPTNQVFFVLAVPGADRDGDGLYDGWEWKHFGRLEQQPSGDYDGDGVSNLEAYTNDYNPNNLTFSLLAANPYVSSATVPVSVNLLTGVAESMAVLLDNTNLTAANWTSFSSNLTVNLGATEGWHELRVGLRGHFAEVQSWQLLRLKLDVTPPRLVVTNPAWLTNSQPLLQLQGYGNEPLANISYNLTNAAGNFTNQPGYVTFEAYNTNTFEFATNYFQCYDVWLTNGANAITVRIADLSGNTTTTNLTLTLDGAGDTTPPTISLVWPQSGMKLGGSAFTVNGFLNDPSATVTATLVSTDGVTNILSGLVGRSGEFWLENLPLNNGTNQLYLTATDFWGNSITTNLAVIKATFDLNVDLLTTEQMQQFTATVTGTISGTGQDVWINGVQAVVSNGVWQADYVPITHDKTTTLQVKAFPTGSDPNSTPSSAEFFLVQDAPPVVEVTSYDKTSTLTSFTTVIPIYQIRITDITTRTAWADKTGGLYQENERKTDQIGWFPPYQYNPVSDCTTTATLPQTLWGGGLPLAATDSCLGSTTVAVPLPAEHKVIASVNSSMRADAQTALKTNGKDVPGSIGTYLVSTLVMDSFNKPIAPARVYHNGKPLTPSAADPNVGQYLAQAPAGATLGNTPKVPDSTSHTWSSTNEGLKLKIFLGASSNDIAGKTNTVVAGQKIELRCEFSHTNVPVTGYQWTIPGFAISNYVTSVNSGLIYSNFPTAKSNVAFYWVDGGTNRQVQCSVTVGGQKLSAKTVFNIEMPNVQMTAEVLGVIGADTNHFYNVINETSFTWLRFGGAVQGTNAIPGIRFSFSPNMSGGYAFIQIGNSAGTIAALNGTNYFFNDTGVDNGIDTNDFRYPLGDGTPGWYVTDDSPANYLANIYTNVTRHDSFTMYLMFEPDTTSEKILVPLKKVSWSWSAVAVLTNSPSNLWSVTSASLPSGLSVLSTSQYPIWTNSLTPGHWVPSTPPLQ